MLVTPPKTPSRATGEIDRLLTELGHPPIANLDEDREILAEAHDDLFEEIAAFARRGWAFSFDAETGMDYDAEEYVRVLAEIVSPLGIRKVTFDDSSLTVSFDDRTLEVPPPEQEDDWLDIGWIFDVATLALEPTSWRLLDIEGADLHMIIVGVVPQDTWLQIEARNLRGAWRSNAPVEVLFN